MINQKNYYRNCLKNSEIRVGGLVYMYLLIIAFIHMKYTMAINSHFSLRMFYSICKKHLDFNKLCADFYDHEFIRIKF